jgi:Uma2 family endonuclease
MSLPRERFCLSVADYLTGERDGAVRHEYVSGQAYAMAGASVRHNRIALNIAGRLNDHLLDADGHSHRVVFTLSTSPSSVSPCGLTSVSPSPETSFAAASVESRMSEFMPEAPPLVCVLRLRHDWANEPSGKQVSANDTGKRAAICLVGLLTSI